MCFSFAQFKEVWPCKAEMSSLTLEMVRGWLKSRPPVRRKPQGAGPSNTTLSGMTCRISPSCQRSRAHWGARCCDRCPTAGTYHHDGDFDPCRGGRRGRGNGQTPLQQWGNWSVLGIRLSHQNQLVFLNWVFLFATGCLTQTKVHVWAAGRCLPDR